MSTKTVALDEESYDLLAKEKRSKETFSDTVKRLASRKGSILESWGMWTEMTDDEVGSIRASRTKARRRDHARMARAVE